MRRPTLFLAAAALLALVAPSGAPAAAGSIALPDLTMRVPTDLISIGVDPASGARELRFTHITSDTGAGPFEIDPAFDPRTGISTFVQALYRSPSPGAWRRDHTVPIAASGNWHPPSDYAFPLTEFTLRRVAAGGSPGAVLARSPKTDYCITGDFRLGDVAHTPDHTFIPQSDCTDPRRPLGWSVGWGDQYDQTDAGQPIDLSGVPDGSYVLRGVVDPRHVFTESDAANDVTDTELQISGDSVTVLGQTTPRTPPPRVSISAPASGVSPHGHLRLRASASSALPGGISAVRFLLDGQPLGPALTQPPYAYTWAVGGARGRHYLSAQAIDAQGNVGTARVVPIAVRAGAGGGGRSPSRPAVRIVNPAPGQLVSGTIPVAAVVTGGTGGSRVQFLLDGHPLGGPVAGPPFATRWRTRGARRGGHRLTARVTDARGHRGSASIVVQVQNPAPPMTCFVMQARQSARGHGTATTAPIHTAMGGEVLLAFVSSDGPMAAGAQRASVSGAGLTWRLVRRANAGFGDSEVWTATAPALLTAAQVTAALANPAYDLSLSVVAMEGARGVGASAAASGATGAPSLTLRTRAAPSLVLAVGNDWSHAASRVLPTGWVLLDQALDTATGDTFWSQYTNQTIVPAGSTVRVNDRAPTNDRWNLVAVELEGGG
jgi:Bacterial Ig domain/Lysyl oxidase